MPKFVLIILCLLPKSMDMQELNKNISSIRMFWKMTKELLSKTLKKLS